MRNRRARDLAALGDPKLTQFQAALSAEPTPDELTGEREALATYRAVSWKRSRSFRRPAVLATKLGVVTTACVVGLSGVATAAYTGSLPDTLQNVAHKAIKAPKAHPPTQAVGPDASGKAAYGLCQAFAKDKENDKDDEAKEQRKAAERAAEQAAEGGSPKATPPGQAKKQEKVTGNGQDGNDRGQSKQKSVAYRNLVRAAGGEDKVEAYCAAVPKPSDAAEPEGSGKPTAKPTQAATGKPTSKPTQAATGAPSQLPTPAATAADASASPSPSASPSELPSP